MAFIDFNICHRMAPLRKLQSMTLTYCLRPDISNINISMMCKSTKIHHTTFMLGHLPLNSIIAKVVFHYVDPDFSLSELQIITNIILKICLHFYGTRHQDSLVFLQALNMFLLEVTSQGPIFLLWWLHSKTRGIDSPAKDRNARNHCEQSNTGTCHFPPSHPESPWQVSLPSCHRTRIGSAAESSTNMRAYNIRQAECRKSQ